ncbi:protein unc-93 homolog A-like [Tubulanus polymorphus]|uniref:protein unc-93 homolog A-like n=1 Tax=Tubulanus polymorphus TaxID=672921 RepID=UPI003DA29A7A
MTTISPQLSPWDLSPVSFDFGFYRPRRPSYLYATRSSRRRTSSYRNATREDSDVDQDSQNQTDAEADPDADAESDFIDGIVQKRRKESYKRANKHDDHEDTSLEQIKRESSSLFNDTRFTSDGMHLKPPPADLRDMQSPPSGNNGTSNSQITIALNDKPIESINTRLSYGEESSVFEGENGRHSTPSIIITGTTGDAVIKPSKWIYRKNMFVMCVSFILVFTVFRSIQNLQSSLNKEDKLGIISMSCVYTTMFLTCLLVPFVISRLGSKWSILLGILFYHFWIAANFYPHFCTLIPTSVAVGLGQSLAWTGQVSYLTKLATDYTYSMKEVDEYDIYKFNGIFLACFQTTHIWGNLVSSLMLHVVAQNQTTASGAVFNGAYGNYSGLANQTVVPPTIDPFQNDDYQADYFKPHEYCGVYDDCLEDAPHILDAVSKALTLAPNSVIKLMAAHLVLAFAGFLLLLLFLDRIGAKGDVEMPIKQMVCQNLAQMIKDRTFRLLIPLLVFNGFEQGFLYSDFNKSFVTCPLGIEYIGYTMITLGASNVLSSMTVGIVAKRMPREVIIGIAGIIQIGLSVFLLILIPKQSFMPIIFISAALWGVCDAVWQTQCNVLITLSCPEDHDIAFTNFRLLQAFGAALAFGLGTVLCMATKMYILICLLVCSMMFYAIAEYRIKQANRPDDDDVIHPDMT